jgi:hypothetical protein
MTAEPFVIMLTAMSQTPSNKASQPSSSEKKSSSAQSASQKADKEARKGDPLPAKSPKERSPKQENL